jgi:hypothetical protein
MPVTNFSQFARTRAVLRFTQHESLGDTYFVNSNTTGEAAGVATGGYQPDAPVTTLMGAQAIAVAAGNQGDIVYVHPAHAESVVGAASAGVFTFSVPGIRYQGLGQGRNRPTITFNTATTAQLIVSGANITFDNFVFDFTGIDAIVAAISVTGSDVAFTNCEFVCNSGTAGVVKGILTAATATRFIVQNCRFIGPAVNTGTTTTAQLDHEVGVDYLFQGNYFCGKMTQAILNATTILRGNIDSNRFVISTGVTAITMAAGSTPLISSNKFNVPSGTLPIVAAAGFCDGNSYSAAAGVTAGTASTF